MGIRKRPRLWTGVSVAALMAATSQQALAAAADDGSPDAVPMVKPGSGAAELLLARGPGGEGEGEGESGAASMGGEFGVDPARAADDPVPYIVVLDVIRAHYLAGLAAFEAGDTEAAGEMFAHPVSEVYLAMEDVFKAQGVSPFDTAMLAASRKALEGAPTAEIRKAVQKVLAAVEAAEAKAPGSERTGASVAAGVLSDLIERAALQYQLVEAGQAGSPYVDGYGYYLAAQARADRALSGMDKEDPEAAEAIRTALGRLKKAYPAIARPKSSGVKAGELLALSSRVRLAVGS